MKIIEMTEELVKDKVITVIGADGQIATFDVMYAQNDDMFLCFGNEGKDEIHYFNKNCIQAMTIWTKRT